MRFNGVCGLATAGLAGACVLAAGCAGKQPEQAAATPKAAQQPSGPVISKPIATAPSRPSTPAHATPSAAPSGDPANPGSVRGTRVRFGIAPGDYAAEDGVLVGSVYDGTPAAKAGLKEGDRMVSWNGTEINTVEDWMPLLGAAKPGDEVTIVFYRGKEKRETKVTLTARGE